MRVLIVHGWGASGQSNWFPWLKCELELKRVRVYLPDLPHAQHPLPEEWTASLLHSVEEFGEDLSIVAHSLGVVATLRLLERLPSHVGTVVLVGGFSHYHWANELAPFFEKPLDWKTIRSKAKRFIILESSNDPFVPFGEGKKLQEHLGAELILEESAGHFASSDGYATYPRILDLLISSM